MSHHHWVSPSTGCIKLRTNLFPFQVSYTAEAYLPNLGFEPSWLLESNNSESFPNNLFVHSETLSIYRNSDSQVGMSNLFNIYNDIIQNSAILSDSVSPMWMNGMASLLLLHFIQFPWRVSETTVLGIEISLQDKIEIYRIFKCFRSFFETSVTVPGWPWSHRSKLKSVS